MAPKISEFRYEVPDHFNLCRDCWEDEANYWGYCAGCYWKRELDAERIQSVWDYDIPDDDVQGY